MTELPIGLPFATACPSHSILCTGRRTCVDGVALKFTSSTRTAFNVLYQSRTRGDTGNCNVCGRKQERANHGVRKSMSDVVIRNALFGGTGDDFWQFVGYVMPIGRNMMEEMKER